MSLINDMLRDLDERGETGSSSDREQIRSLLGVTDEPVAWFRRPAFLVIIVLSLTSIAIALTFYYRLMSGSSLPAVVEMTAPESSQLREPETQIRPALAQMEGPAKDDPVVNASPQAYPPQLESSPGNKDVIHHESPDQSEPFTAVPSAVTPGRSEPIEESLADDEYLFAPSPTAISANPAPASVSVPAPEVASTARSDGSKVTMAKPAPDTEREVKADTITAAPERNRTEAETSTIIVSEPLPAVMSSRQSEVELLQNAKSLLAAGRRLDAETYMQKALVTDPGKHRLRLMLAKTLLTYNPEQAKQVALQGLMLLPNHHEYRLALAHSYMQTKDYESAAAALSEQNPVMSEALDYYTTKAAVLQFTNDYAASERLYQQLLQLQAANARWLLGLAIAQDQLGQYPEARVNYQKVLVMADVDRASRAYAQKQVQRLQGVEVQ
ncbi:hypothetical protein MIB92_04980 [Aestuariirhabdus sp. Z084]|uniref:tetratricopeptide repeat protein n=1 Tax=Aestuariirhabdus haliotis TaxID=2918751 RepID=UPI00201B3D96|nr:tetratricopeptide repeat protein [Aestuariirhabdus haliotis]MCL6414994.1 hypothetical protein [Aestuariirhabdus haliotis]MCL6418926.1 hypothetical protein [Aestuariirhabdus haliotis]